MLNKNFEQIHESAQAREMRKSENYADFKTMTNGCGPSGWKVDLVPDTIYLLSINYECSNHDIDWTFAKTWDEAGAANRLFKKAVHYKIKKHHWALRTLRYLRFNWYFLAVNGTKGKKHFTEIKDGKK